MANWIIDRTINLDEFKTREVLNALLEEPRKSDVELENILHSKGVLKNAGDGALRRRWYTYLRNYGLLNGDEVTEMGKLYATKELALHDVALLQLSKKRIQIQNNNYIMPLKILVGIIYCLNEFSSDEAFITREEFTNYIVNIEDDNKTSIENICSLIINSRKNGDYLKGVEGQHDDIWFNSLSQTKLFDYIGRSLFVKDMAMIKRLNNFYSSDNSKVLYGKLVTGIVASIQPLIKRDSSFNLDSDLLSEELKAKCLDNILFLTGNKVAVEEQYFKNKRNYNGIIELLNSLNLSNENIGIYKDFSNYKNIVYSYLKFIGDNETKQIVNLIKSHTNDYETEIEDNVIIKEEEFDFSSSQFTDGQNLIVYGTPGCGKSYYVQHTLLNGYKKDNYIRTTFFQDYTNTDFVGQILPYVEKDENDKDVVTYKFNPGPFALALEQAIRNPNEKVALVIEELNRGSAASIFGDIFQLLDRKNGVSEYSITNVNIIDYLKKQFKGIYTFKDIRIPGNLSIFATMNTSDQNVFTLDTAFKRRWKFKKLINKFDDTHKFKNKFIPGPTGKADVTWEEVVNAINEYILEVSDGLNSEDKQIGVYFIDEKEMREEKTTISKPEDVEAFAYKVFEYLWDDVAKFSRSDWFEKEIKSLDQLVEEYKKNGIEVFNDDIFKRKR